MKKLVVMIIAVLLSGCADDSSVHSDKKILSCEASKACSTALEYATYQNQGATDKAFEMEIDNGNGRSYSKIEDAKKNIASDYEVIKDKKIENYIVLEYEVITDKKFVYRIEFKDIRTQENKILDLKVEKQGSKYMVERYYRFVPNSAITRGDKIVPYTKYYAKGMSQQMKEELEPKPIEKE
ncbi:MULTISPECIES: hypothetical protein [Bacillus cereus group]|uniref:Lipoprotein n=1 Tax=Bacillus cereus TaxID=1396 RepID=A0A9X7M2B0_BACCE|nr:MULTISPECIES: hypothetical protein [Bacillus cereus group]MCQ6288112.1 hypothetical protein [Bacillus cereus]MCQ6316529.1 hypothetical protein [Bacillus cereus]MCQ6327672.1 hypothetical protein [Bacillus cereus]MCQ6385150.1 hypothetical protein [Bacillus cereus]MDF9626096.1 hypothetical protein [Bacillus cereus]